MRREKWFASLLLFFFAFSLSNIQLTEQYGETILILRTNGGGIRPDYGLYIAQYLKDLNIDLDVKVHEWVIFQNILLVQNDFDLSIVEIGPNLLSSSENSFPLSSGGSFLDMRELFTENGSLNIFRLEHHMPYYNESISLQNRILNETDPSKRELLSHEWQYLMVDKIIPFFPLFYPQNYEVVWSNTLGYNSSWGLSNSLPYMSYDGPHEGQNNQTELIIADANWKESNPLFIVDSTSYQLADFIFEPIIQINPAGAPIETGIVETWNMIDEFHYKFQIRDNLFWNPSYNITNRNSSSLPLSSILDGELMKGLKNIEFSNGSNQQVTAKDVVFTYLTWSNPLIKSSIIYQEWISNIYIDPIDDLAFHIHIDCNPQTEEVETFNDFWSHLPILLLPEFFLNSSDSTVSYTSGGVKTVGLYSGITDTPQWRTYSTSAFGCGKFMLDYHDQYHFTVLQKSPYWFGIGAIDGTIGMEPFVETLKIRWIPDKWSELTEFNAGNLDWMDITALPSNRKIIQTDNRFSIQNHQSNKMSILAFNLRRPFIGGVDNFVFLDGPGLEEYTRGVGIRKAICYAIDRDEMNQVIYDGEYLISHSVLPPSAADYYASILKYSRDLDVAFCWLNGVNPDVLRYDTEWYYYGLPIIFLPIIILISLPTKYWERVVRKLFRRGGKVK